jgi:hypothetical protein
VPASPQKPEVRHVQVEYRVPVVALRPSSLSKSSLSKSSLRPSSLRHVASRNRVELRPALLRPVELRKPEVPCVSASHETFADPVVSVPVASVPVSRASVKSASVQSTLRQAFGQKIVPRSVFSSATSVIPVRRVASRVAVTPTLSNPKRILSSALLNSLRAGRAKKVSRLVRRLAKLAHTPSL